MRAIYCLDVTGVQPGESRSSRLLAEIGGDFENMRLCINVKAATARTSNKVTMQGGDMPGEVTLLAFEVRKPSKGIIMRGIYKLTASTSMARRRKSFRHYGRRGAAARVRAIGPCLAVKEADRIVALY